MSRISSLRWSYARYVVPEVQSYLAITWDTFDLGIFFNAIKSSWCKNGDIVVSLGIGTATSLGFVSLYSPGLAPAHGSFLPIAKYILFGASNIICNNQGIDKEFYFKMIYIR